MEMRAGHERADTIATITIVRGDMITFNKKKKTHIRENNYIGT
jgi:hypothetical protein